MSSTSRAQNNEGEIVSDQGKLEEAEALFLEAQRVWRAARYPVGVALATSNLGRVAARVRRFDEALELLSEALAAFEALGSERSSTRPRLAKPSASCSPGATRRLSRPTRWR
jgi:tetratricopeptide (TPR) repeat protein